MAGPTANSRVRGSRHLSRRRRIRWGSGLENHWRKCASSMSTLREWLPLSDGYGAVERNVLPPSSLYPCLLTGRRNPGSLCPIAFSAGRDKVLEAGGSAL